MKLKLKILISLLLLSLTSFSQIDTSKVCLPYQTAKKVAIDLIEGDKAKVELYLTKQILQDTEKKVSLQDSITSICEEKVIICTTQLALKDQIIEKQTQEAETLAKKNKRLIITRKILSFALAVTTLTAFIGFATN